MKQYVLTLIVIVSLSMFAGGCKTATISGNVQPSVNGGTIEPVKIPSWCGPIPQDENGKYFCAISREASTQQRANKDAQENGRFQVVNYLGTYIKSDIQRIAVNLGLESDVLDPGSADKEFLKVQAEAIANLVEVKNQEMYVINDPVKGRAYMNYVLMYFPTTKATKAAAIEAVKAKADYEYRRNNLNQEQMDRAKKLLDELQQ